MAISLLDTLDAETEVYASMACTLNLISVLDLVPGFNC